MNIKFRSSRISIPDTKQNKEFEQHKCSHMFLIHPEAKQVCRETNKMADELANKFFEIFYERQLEKFVEEGWLLGKIKKFRLEYQRREINESIITYRKNWLERQIIPTINRVLHTNQVIYIQITSACKPSKCIQRYLTVV